jgi:hypothetical protein
VARPPTDWQFFAAANQHIGWERNAMARRRDEQAAGLELHIDLVAATGRTESDEPRWSGGCQRLFFSIWKAQDVVPGSARIGQGLPWATTLKILCH